ncbi:MAG: hypothetical protein ACI4MH_06960 [Candidatus Coproplasma sp.]
MIVAVKKDDRVVVGISICDDSRDMTPKDLALADNLPLWKVKGEKDCYVCVEYLQYSTDVLRFNDHIFRGISDGESIIKKVIPAMKELLSEYGCTIGGRDWYNQLLIIKGNKIFKISNFFCVSEEEDYAALGYDDYFAGALDAMRDTELTQRVLTAIRHTARMTNRQIFPVTVFDTNTKRRKVYYK